MFPPAKMSDTFDVHEVPMVPITKQLETEEPPKHLSVSLHVSNDYSNYHRFTLKSRDYGAPVRDYHSVS